MIKYDSEGNKIITGCRKCGCTKAVQNYLCPNCGEVVIEDIISYEGHTVKRKQVDKNTVFEMISKNN